MAFSDVRQKVFRIPGSIVLSVGLSWDFVGAEPVDLDLSAVCFTKEGRFLDVVFFNHLFPEGTDEAALRAHYRVDPGILPYMFLSGDSTVGGEEENQLPGLALAARRRQRQLRQRAGAGGGGGGAPNGLATRDYTGAASNIFNRLYEEEQLADVQMAADEAIGYEDDGGESGDDADGSPRRRRHPRKHRELSDEVLTFVMAKIPREADAIFLTVSSYTGQDFTLLSRARLELYNESTNERVGIMDLRSSTENGTANLAAMLVRVPEDTNGSNNNEFSDAGGSGGEWDLRELNVRTFGYTFVDVLPLVMDVLGVPENHRLDVLQNLPDYSLSKIKSEMASWTLSDVRFGVGWSGEHDVDAFLVLLDENHNYVDHLYPKHGKLRSMVRDLARHSGDALCGTPSAGDEEFIDLLTYRVPPNVGSIVIGANWMESFGPARHHTKSIFDVPDLYLRLQNRTVMNPYSMELDRWPVFREARDPAVAAQLPKTYKDAAKRSCPVRTVVLGALVKTGTQPFDALFPNRRRIDQHFQKHGNTNHGGGSVDGRGQSRGTSVTSRAGVSEFEAGRDDEVPIFQLVPIHQYVPVDPREGFSRVIPYLQCLMTYAMTAERDTIAAARRRTAAESANRDAAEEMRSMENTADGTAHSASAVAEPRFILNRGNNMVGWAPTTGRNVQRSAHATATMEAAEDRAAADDEAAEALRDRYGRMWREMQHYDNRTDLFAIAVQFLEVVEVHPQMPQRFQCHGEAWVFGQTNCVVPVHGDISVFDNKPYRSPPLVDRTKLVWSDAGATAKNGGGSCGHFLVRKYDRLRVVLFETASVGIADLDLLSIDALWEGEEPHRGSGGGLADRFNTVECNVRLDGGPDMGTTVYSGEIRLRLSRVPVAAAMKRLQRQADKENEKRERVAEAHRRSDERHFNKTYQPCAIM